MIVTQVNVIVIAMHKNIEIIKRIVKITDTTLDQFCMKNTDNLKEIKKSFYDGGVCIATRYLH